MTDISMLIGGAQRAAANGATFERRNPLDHSVATRAPSATVEDARAAVDAAAKAFPVWSAMGPGERRALLMKASHALEAKGEAFAKAMREGLGREVLLVGEMLVERAVREAGGLADVGHAHAVDTVLLEQPGRRIQQREPVLFRLFLGHFHEITRREEVLAWF